MGSLLLIVFVKLRRQHGYTASSGSSTTSESTIRSAATPLPSEEAFCTEPLNKENRKTTPKPQRERRQNRDRRRHDLLCDGKHIPRCACAVVSECDSGSGSVSDTSPQKRNSGLYRTLERTIEEEEDCDCPQCLAQRKIHVHEHFGIPEKKYYGDWMVQEAFIEEQPRDNRNHFPQYI